MRWLLVLVLGFPLAGCFADQKRQVAACEIEALKTYPGEQLETSPKVGSFMQTCMAAHGYAWHIIDERCNVSFTTERNPYCYIPDNPIGRWIYQLETSQNSN